MVEIVECSLQIFDIVWSVIGLEFGEIEPCPLVMGIRISWLMDVLKGRLSSIFGIILFVKGRGVLAVVHKSLHRDVRSLKN